MILLLNLLKRQEKYRSIPISNFKGIHGCLLVFDLANINSFDHISHWIRLLRSHTNGDVPCLLIANKCDLENPEVSIDDIKLKHKKKFFFYFYFIIYI